MVMITEPVSSSDLGLPGNWIAWPTQAHRQDIPRDAAPPRREWRHAEHWTKSLTLRLLYVSCVVPWFDFHVYSTMGKIRSAHDYGGAAFFGVVEFGSDILRVESPTMLDDTDGLSRMKCFWRALVGWEALRKAAIPLDTSSN